MFNAKEIVRLQTKLVLWQMIKKDTYKAAVYKKKTKSKKKKNNLNIKL